MRRAWLCLWLLFGCEVATGPVDPVWGKQPCAHCMMLLSEPRAAAQVQRADGSHLYFDDIGCMMESKEASEATVRGRWVRGADGQGWTDARSARYGSGHATPMDYGVLAAPTGMSYDEARQLVQARSRARKEALR